MSRRLVPLALWLCTCALAAPAFASDGGTAALVAAADGGAPPDGGAPAAGRRPDAIVGDWWTESRAAIVRFSRAKDGTYLGVLRWGNNPQKDVNNPDPKLRDRAVIGIVLMWHLRYEDGEYVDGYVYNPEDGDTYRMNAEVLSPESLKIRGYLGIALFGKTQTWARVRPN